MQVNCRHVPSFFLGCVFIAAAASSASFLWALFARLKQSVVDVDHLDSASEKALSVDTDSSFSLCKGESRTLVFIVSFCFASASITFFASLLSFSIEAGAACAFVVAWGSIASQLARIVGLIILFLELRRLGIQRWESVGFALWAIVGIVFVFINSAFATGITVPFPDIGVALCERKHSLPTSLTVSLIFILLEGYTIFRFWSLLVPGFLRFDHQVVSIRDFRIFRGTALLLFELLTLVPSAIHTNIIADFLPYSIGALLVICAFRPQIRFPRAPETISIPASTPVARSTPQLRQNIPPTIYSGAQTELFDDFPPLHYHPFSSKPLRDSPRQSEWLDMPRTARSSRTVDTLSTNSVHNAVVHVARRTPHPFDYSLERLSTPGGSLPDGDVATTPTAPTSTPSRIVPSQNVLAEMLDHGPPKAVARPRLVVVTNAVAEKNESSQPSSSVLRPLMQQSALFRLTPTFVPTENSHLSMSSSESHSGSNASSNPSNSSRSLPSSPVAARNSVFSVPPPAHEAPNITSAAQNHDANTVTVTTTFGGGESKFRATGYKNPIQSGWSHVPRRSLGLPSRPHPLPLPEEWPTPPSTLLPTSMRTGQVVDNTGTEEGTRA